MKVEYRYACKSCGRHTRWYSVDTFARLAASVHTLRKHYAKVSHGIPLLAQITGTLKYIFQIKSRKKA